MRSAKESGRRTVDLRFRIRQGSLSGAESDRVKLSSIQVFANSSSRSKHFPLITRC